MDVTRRFKADAATALLLLLTFATASGLVVGQRGAGVGSDPNLSETPLVVTPADLSAEVTGPGTMYPSVQSLPEGQGLEHFGYEAQEYFVSGITEGRPYKTRIVVRKPANAEEFSGLVLAEAMHPSGSAHLFEYTSNYLMDSGHAAVEIVVSGFDNLTDYNGARYADIGVEPDQVSGVLAQVGALLKDAPRQSSLLGLEPRKLILSGTSATAGILIRYLPGHMVYRTRNMERIFDGFLPHANGSDVRQVDVPLIQIPTMTEVVGGNTTARPDGDAPGDQFRLYEFAGMAHVDTRENVRFKPDPCVTPVSSFPLQAYVSVGLHHLFEWTDKGIIPPRAPRIIVDRDIENDGSVMLLDVDGNAVGGVRNPYVDLPIAQHGVRNEAVVPVIANPSAYIAANGQAGANQMCRLGGYERALSESRLRDLYASPETYRSRVRSRLDELEAAGWSLPLYREMILADAEKVDF